MQQKESKTNKHFYNSIAKSIFRIIAFVILFKGNVEMASAILIVVIVFGVEDMSSTCTKLTPPEEVSSVILYLAAIVTPY